MWKVVVTEIQDAHELDPLAAPPGAFFVNTERFAETVEHLDLPALIDAVARMQHLEAGVREERPATGKKATRGLIGPARPSLVKGNSPGREPSRSRALPQPRLSRQLQ